MTHAAGDVILVVKETGGLADEEGRDDFLDEDNAAPPGFAVETADIKAEIYFFKILMKENGDAEHLRFAKEKSDQAYVRDSTISIYNGSGRGQRFEDFAFHGKVEHDQVAPLGGEKRRVARGGISHEIRAFDLQFTHPKTEEVLEGRLFNIKSGVNRRKCRS